MVPFETPLFGLVFFLNLDPRVKPEPYVSNPNTEPQPNPQKQVPIDTLNFQFIIKAMEGRP